MIHACITSFADTTRCSARPACIPPCLLREFRRNAASPTLPPISAARKRRDEIAPTERGVRPLPCGGGARCKKIGALYAAGGVQRALPVAAFRPVRKCLERARATSRRSIHCRREPPLCLLRAAPQRGCIADKGVAVWREF